MSDSDDVDYFETASRVIESEVRITELEAEVDRLTAILVAVYHDDQWQTVQDLEEERDRLKAEVAHFQTEYQDEIGRTELIENVERLKAEVARLTADDMSNRWQEVAGDLFRRVSELEVIKIKSEARIAELEAEVARQATEIEFLNDVGDERHAEKVKLEAERDRLLGEIAEIKRARAALSDEGVKT